MCIHSENGSNAMMKNIDTSELERLKGISIGTTHDDQPFLVLTYTKHMATRAIPWIVWLVGAIVSGACGYMICWILR